MELTLLPDGIYERVISDELGKVLDEASKEEQIWKETETVDSQEGARYLSDYAGRLIHCCLKEIADQDEEGSTALSKELHLVNDLIRLLSKRMETLGEGHTVSREDFLLTQLKRRQNTLKEIILERPLSGLSHSTLFTNSKKDVSLVTELQREIQSADRIDLLVSFIKYSGYIMIRPYLQEFTRHGGKLRVLTTTYMGATDPKAVAELAALPNTEVRISYNVKETRLHAKAYIFYRSSGFSSAYVGSSNLSHAAIADGLEWNMKITQQDMPIVMEKIHTTFDTYWHSDEFQDFSEKDRPYLEDAIDAERGRDKKEGSALSYAFRIRPYPYQEQILDALQAERQIHHRTRNLVVAATGTGKTAIAAFDYARFAKNRNKETRLLFVAHREEILTQSLSAFRQVLQDPGFGELSVGNFKAKRADHLFISIQTFQHQRLWEKLDSHYYDMIIVDEFHHAAAPSYQKLLSYFKPRILLGLTATPERMDGKDILSYFDGHMAAEIRLSEAIERRLLVPFHYFGVEDPIDLSHVAWSKGQYETDELIHLYARDHTAEIRANAILRALTRYTSDLRDVKGIGFCVGIQHAEFMARFFTKAGIPSLALSGDTPDEVRRKAAADLASGRLTFLFVVDIFNEGVDIPAVNTVLFLRPTNSLTIFLQQLGRGLRLFEGKDCLTVLDFVAQANRKYDFASRLFALMGTRNLSIRREVQLGFPHAPKGCCIQLEKVAQQRILENINSQLKGLSYYLETIRELYEITGSVPTLAEFFKASGIDSHLFYNGKRTYTRLLMKAGLIEEREESLEEKVLMRAYPTLLSLDSPHWISYLKENLKAPQRPTTILDREYAAMLYHTLLSKDLEALGIISPEALILSLSHWHPFIKELEAFLTMQENALSFLPQSPGVLYPCALEVYCHYTRNQIFAALGYDHPSSIREGVKFLTPEKSFAVTHPTDVFLVTLNKSDRDFSETTRYEDYSIDRMTFHWQSQSTTTPHSKTGQRYERLCREKEKAGYILLFVRENKKDAYGGTQSYTFLGRVSIERLQGSQPMTAILKLALPLSAGLLTETDASGVL